MSRETQKLFTMKTTKMENRSTVIGNQHTGSGYTGFKFRKAQGCNIIYLELPCTDMLLLRHLAIRHPGHHLDPSAGGLQSPFLSQTKTSLLLKFRKKNDCNKRHHRP